MQPDTTLTPYERRRWKQLRRQLEADAPPGRARRGRRLAAVVALLALLGTGVVGGTVAMDAVALYLTVFLAMWGLHRLVWRGAPTPAPMKDLI